MEDIQRLRLQYGAAMAHQEVFKQHIYNYQPAHQRPT